MAMHIQSHPVFFCPQCRRRMTTIRLAVPEGHPARTVSGCEHCGITLNELARPEFLSEKPGPDSVPDPAGRG